jgi:hypothetical protein
MLDDMREHFPNFRERCLLRHTQPVYHIGQ